MFICKKCTQKREPLTFSFDVRPKSLGVCELCNQYDQCIDISHSVLPAEKAEKKQFAHSLSQKIHKKLESVLPFYFPASRKYTEKLHLAVWNCGTRPQTLRQALKTTRITIRNNYYPIIVLKKGDV